LRLSSGACELLERRGHHRRAPLLRPSPGRISRALGARHGQARRQHDRRLGAGGRRL